MISAVIVNHKSFNFLEPLINSLKKEGVEEIVLVDNSLDKEEEKKLENLKGIELYFLNENNGLGCALNFGAKKAKGEFLLFCNPDLIFKDGSIKELKREINNFQAVGPFLFWDEEEEFCLPYPHLVNFSFEFFKIFFPKLISKSYLKYENKIWNSKKPLKLSLLSGSCFLIKKDIFEKVRGFDENYFLYFEENDFFKRFKEMGFKSSLVPSSKVVHFFNLKKSEIHNKYYEDSKKYFEKKYFPAYIRLILNFSRKIIKRKEKKVEEIKHEDIKSFAILLSPFSDFIPSVLIKNTMGWGELEEKLKKVSFNEGYIGFVRKNSVLKSFYFKVK